MADKKDAKDLKKPAAGPSTENPMSLSEMRRASTTAAEERKAPLPQPREGIRVRATTTGFYGGARRRAGSTFVISATAKPAKWMEVVGKTD